MRSERTESDATGKSDMRVVRAALRLVPETLADYEPAALPARITSYVRRSERRQLQTLLVEVIAALERRAGVEPGHDD